MDKNRNSATASGSSDRYELRSKRKEDPEPKLEEAKKEVNEANGTQGRKKWAVCSMSRAAAAFDGGSVTDGSGDLASTEMTFSIDHIREQIFRSLPNADLRNCRQVCHSWNSTASLELQKRIKYFLFDSGRPNFHRNLGLLNKRPKTMLGLPLPASTFWFCKRTYSAAFLKNRAMLSFLSKYGPGIKELSFASEFCGESKPEEKDVIDFVTNLLVHLTPNLSKLRIMFKYSAPRVEGGSSRKWNSSLSTTDPEFKEIHSKTWGTNSKLKVLSLYGVSAKLIETVIRLAPNLSEINASGFYFKACDFIYFLEPLDRFGYLKEIKFDPESVEEMEIFEANCEFIQSEDTGLKLRAFSFSTPSFMEADSWPTPRFLKSPDMRARAENVINCLLECSRNSLETITGNSSTGLLGLKWPEELPNVQKLGIGVRALGYYPAFPNGFSWLTKFPKLRSISLYNVECDQDFTDAIDLLFQNQKIESVKDILVHGEELSRKYIRLTEAQLKRLKNIFPNAKINVCVPFFVTLYPGSSKVQLCCRCDCRI